jgi:hypothetical protein
LGNSLFLSRLLPKSLLRYDITHLAPLHRHTFVIKYVPDFPEFILQDLRRIFLYCTSSTLHLRVSKAKMVLGIFKSLPAMEYPPAQEGWWSPVTSTLNWCEEVCIRVFSQQTFSDLPQGLLRNDLLRRDHQHFGNARFQNSKTSLAMDQITYSGQNKCSLSLGVAAR